MESRARWPCIVHASELCGCDVVCARARGWLVLTSSIARRARWADAMPDLAIGVVPPFEVSARSIASVFLQHPLCGHGTACATEVHSLAHLTMCIIRHRVMLGKIRDPYWLLPYLLQRAESEAAPSSSNRAFLEIGAADGVIDSQTLVLEGCFNWNGVLIEPNPTQFASLNSSARRATKYHAAGCQNGRTVGISNYTSGAAAVPELTSSGYLKRWGAHVYKHGLVNVSCIELNTALDSAGHTSVDFISVDTQGAEDHVLKTVDLKRLDLVQVEAEGYSAEKNARVRQMLNDAGFRQLPKLYTEGRRDHHNKNTGANELYEAARPPRATRRPLGVPNQTFANLHREAGKVGYVVDALAAAVAVGYRPPRRPHERTVSE